MTEQANTHVTLSPLIFAILKTKQPVQSALVNIIDLDDVTVIIEQSKYAAQSKVISAVLDWKLFTLAPVSLSEAGSIITRVAGAMTANGIGVVPITAFDREHFLIKKPYLATAIIQFETLGLKVIKL